MPLIQNSTTLESLKQECGCNLISASSATDTLSMSLASNRADSNSSLAMDCLLTGGTRVFDATKLTVVPALPLSSSKLLQRMLWLRHHRILQENTGLLPWPKIQNNIVELM